MRCLSFLPHRLGLALLLVCAPALLAMDLSLDGTLTQGGLLRGQVAPGAQVTLDGEPVATTPDGFFTFGFGRDHPETSVLTVSSPDGTTAQHSLRIAPREYQVQHIKGLPSRLVSPKEEDLTRIREDQAQVAEARAESSALLGFTERFQWPVEGVITGVYGSARVLNGEPRNPHYGIDIAAEEGTPVYAPASGRITLAHPDMFYTGGTVILDHGYGVSSTFLHLQAIEAELGQELRRGERFATVGSTGRSTGPHLDWRMNWFDTRVDPALLVGPIPESADTATAP